MLDRIVGTPETPVPGSTSRRSPAHARKFAKDATSDTPAFTPQEQPEVQVRAFRILKADVEAHGSTPGCAGCRAIRAGGTYKSNHTPECRMRFEEILRNTPSGMERLAKADDRIAREIVRRSGLEPHGDVAPEGGADEEAGPPKRAR